MQPLVIPMIIVVFLLVVMTGVSIWAYSLYNDQRNNVNARVEEAVIKAEDALRVELETDFNEREKSPLATFNGSATLGSIVLKYPKTWSAYIKQRESGTVGIEGYFHPRFVPDLQSETAYALRLSLVNRSFDSELTKYQRNVESGKLKSTPVTVAGVEGVRIDGPYDSGIEGSIVLLPLRDKTLKVFTESTDFLKDFNGTILENLSFIP